MTVMFYKSLGLILSKLEIILLSAASVSLTNSLKYILENEKDFVAQSK